MKNPFKQAEIFQFSKGELVAFEAFMRNMVPLSAARWPDKEHRPNFEGLPEYSLSVAITEDQDKDPRILIGAKFNSMFRTETFGEGNMLILKIESDIEQIFISTVNG